MLNKFVFDLQTGRSETVEGDLPTTEELASLGAEILKAELMERTRSLTADEVYAMLIATQINTLTVDDNTALRMRQFYPTFDSVVGQTAKQGFKFTQGGKLWRVVQPELTLQSHYSPGTGTESLYEEICETHEGTLEDPIPYSGNMALAQGRHYVQDWVIYRCIRDTEAPVYHPLAELVGLYVEVAV